MFPVAALYVRTADYQHRPKHMKLMFGQLQISCFYTYCHQKMGFSCLFLVLKMIFVQ